MSTPSKMDSSLYEDPSIDFYPILKTPADPSLPPYLLQYYFYWKWVTRITQFHLGQHGIVDVRKRLTNFHKVWLFTNSLQSAALGDMVGKDHLFLFVGIPLVLLSIAPLLVKPSQAL